MARKSIYFVLVTFFSSCFSEYDNYSEKYSEETLSLSFSNLEERQKEDTIYTTYRDGFAQLVFNVNSFTTKNYYTVTSSNDSVILLLDSIPYTYGEKKEFIGSDFSQSFIFSTEKNVSFDLEVTVFDFHGYENQKKQYYVSLIEEFSFSPSLFSLEGNKVSLNLSHSLNGATAVEQSVIIYNIAGSVVYENYELVGKNEFNFSFPKGSYLLTLSVLLNTGEEETKTYDFEVL